MYVKQLSVSNPIIINSVGKEFDEAIAFLLSERTISVDTETTGTDPLVHSVLLVSAGGPTRQYVFDVARIGKSAVIDALKPILENTSKLIIIQNAKFDYKFFKADLGITIERIYDTMIAEMLLLKGRKVQGFGLDDIASKYLNVTLNKDIRQTFVNMKFGATLNRDQLIYSAMDVQYLEDIMIQQQALLQKHGLEQVFRVEMEALPPTGDMELNGIYLNKKKWLATEDLAKTERAAMKIVLDALFAPVVGQDMFGNANINYNSPKQLLPALKSLIGKPAAGLKSTGEDALKEIDHPIIAALLKYREKEKRVSTYGEVFLENIHPKTGRIHSSFSQLYTDTGRYSSSDPNLQNIPADAIYRSAFTGATEDYRIVGCDYSGMELRILADLSQETSWIDCFKRGGDLHSENGSKLYRKTIRRKGTNGPNDPGENEELRRPVKSLNFGLSYGMGPTKLARETGMSFDEAKTLFKAFWKEFPRIKAYFDHHVRVSMDARCVRSPYDGRLRWLDGFDYDSHKDQARIRNICMNFPMQAGNATITKKALTLIRADIVGKDAKLISTVHDEILVECHKDIETEVYNIVRTDMINAAQHYIKNVPVDVEGHISTHWEK